MRHDLECGTRRRTARRSVVSLALAALLLVAAACTSDDSSQSADTTTTTSAITPTAESFSIPEGLRDRVEEAGLPFEEIDYATAPDDVPWPTEEWPTGDLPDDVDPAEVQAVVDKAFGELSSDDQSIDAILVVKDGRLVVEEYNNWDPDEVHASWSMAKSINSALVGILVGEGRLDITEPVDAPEWSEPGDPRAEITLDELLRMSSGLEWEESYEDSNGDVLKTLGSDSDRAGYTASKPLADEPDTEWYYSTGTANLIARSVAEEVGYGDELTNWIDEALLQPLGITKVEHLLDETGLHSGGSYINLTPRDFARFGLLYARDGIWDGERIVPEGWVDYSRMPTPTTDHVEYGAQWWLDEDHPGMFNASGYNGQTINVFPEEDLVIVVLSTAGDSRDEEVREELFDIFGV
ncbi:MAG: beta-lactamase family protein [Acidimicrobiia bacterium]|nr:beta-lactamase family protein [Acidimicrobiia bacterium]